MKSNQHAMIAAVIVCDCVGRQDQESQTIFKCQLTMDHDVVRTKVRRVMHSIASCAWDLYIVCAFSTEVAWTSLTHGMLQDHRWEPDGFRIRPGCPCQNWMGVINKDLKKIGIGWDEVQEAVEDRRSWWNSVSQCVFDAGWTRNQ